MVQMNGQLRFWSVRLWTPGNFRDELLERMRAGHLEPAAPRQSELKYATAFVFQFVLMLFHPLS